MLVFCQVDPQILYPKVGYMGYKYKSGVQSGVQSGVPNEIQVIECDMFRHFCQILIGYKSHNLKEVWVLEVWALDPK